MEVQSFTRCHCVWCQGQPTPEEVIYNLKKQNAALLEAARTAKSFLDALEEWSMSYMIDDSCSDVSVKLRAAIELAEGKNK